MPKTLVFAYPLFTNATIPRNVFIRPARKGWCSRMVLVCCSYQEVDADKENQNTLTIFALDWFLKSSRRNSTPLEPFNYMFRCSNVVPLIDVYVMSENGGGQYSVPLSRPRVDYPQAFEGGRPLIEIEMKSPSSSSSVMFHCRENTSSCSVFLA